MKHALLCCNGMDKALGGLAREVTLRCAEATGSEIICPVLLNNAPARYRQSLDTLPLVVIDGCATRCATKLATQAGARIERKLLVADEVKGAAVAPEKTLSPGPVGLELARQLAEALARELLAVGAEPAAEPATAPGFETPTDFLTVTHDKYIFRIPSAGYLFNENDCWVQVSGTRARVGVSDYVQQKLTDIIYYEPPKVGAVVEQFGEVGAIESTKAVLEVISPVSGVVVAVNPLLADSPGLVNEEPYTGGWIAELEITDLDSDAELLIDGAAYAAIVKKKAAEDSK